MEQPNAGSSRVTWRFSFPLPAYDYQAVTTPHPLLVADLVRIRLDVRRSTAAATAVSSMQMLSEERISESSLRLRIRFNGSSIMGQCSTLQSSKRLRRRSRPMVHSRRGGGAVMKIERRALGRGGFRAFEARVAMEPGVPFTRDSHPSSVYRSYSSTRPVYQAGVAGRNRHGSQIEFKLSIYVSDGIHRRCLWTPSDAEPARPRFRWCASRLHGRIL